ncbi:MAG TPA: hypothetical protein VL400_03295 [Polyangiaceae bacterium]|nr:hypothetical protein [Polyangiaceae bacterium]
MAAGVVDPRAFPALADYLAKLPSGLASYPAARSKGILLRSSMSSHFFHRTWKDLPRELVDAVKAPPLATSWVSTALTDAVFCLVADTFHPTREAVLEWSYERTYRLTHVPMYATLTKMAGLDRFLRACARVHAMFQQGTDLSVDVRGTTAEIVLSHPPHLHGPLNHLSNEGVFRAVLDAAGARNATMSLETSEPERATYRASWER